jgi:hypothetical protein
MKKLISIGIVSLFIISGFVIIPCSVGGGDMPSPEPAGDMIIDGFTFEIRDAGTFDIDGNVIIINGGELRVINSTLNFLCTAVEQYYLECHNGGTLILQNSTITTAATPIAQWNPTLHMLLDGSILEMKGHSVLAFPGSLECYNTLVYVNDSWITSIWPEARWTPWATDFPTYMDAVDTNWWVGTTVDLDDSTDDGPALWFYECDNITIADSRIDELYENWDMPSPGTFTLYFLPNSLHPTKSTGTGYVQDLWFEDGYYYTLSGYPQMIWVDGFNTMGYNDEDFNVLSSELYVVYKNPGYNCSYPVNNYFNYSIPSILTNTSAFIIAQNQPSNVFNVTDVTPNIFSLSRMTKTNVHFLNYDDDLDPSDTFYIDLIQLNVTLEPQFDTYPTMITLNNSEMSVINSYVNVDWLNFSSDFQQHNAFDLINGANLYLYNVSMETDDNGNGVDDFLEVPGTSDPELFMPYRTEPSSEVYHYKWLKVPVVDGGGGPINGASVNATFASPNQWYVDRVQNMNDLTLGTPANNRILGYLNRTSGRSIDALNYTLTDEYGEVLLPLLCEFINSTCYPNGDHVGNYLIDVEYNDGIWHYGNGAAEFIPFPNVRPEENLVVLDPIVLGDVVKRSYILEAGSWNLISLPHIQLNTTLQAVLSSIDGKWDYMQFYDATDPTIPWESYSVYRPDSVNDLYELNHTIGFWLHTSERCVLTSDGPLAGSTNIPLYAGWNLVGYPTLTEGKTVSEALFGTGADRIEVCDLMAPYRISEVGASYVMSPGEGYWIHVPADTVWTVDW